MPWKKSEPMEQRVTDGSTPLIGRANALREPLRGAPAQMNFRPTNDVLTAPEGFSPDHQSLLTNHRGPRPSPAAAESALPVGMLATDVRIGGPTPDICSME
jgi:hypothetical protein